MRLSFFTTTALAVTAFSLSACSGQGHNYNNYGAYNGQTSYQAHGYQDQGQNYQGCQTTYTNPCGHIQPVYTAPVPQQTYADSYGGNSYVVPGPRGSQNNNYGAGTVLRGSAPYGAAVDSAAWSYFGERPMRQRGVYTNLGLVNYDSGTDMYGIQGRVGYDFNPNFATEFEASFGISEDRIGGSTVGVDYSTAVFAVAKAPVSSNLSLFARAGYHNTKFGVDGSPAIKTDGFAYGLGGEYALSPRNALRLDYTRYSTNVANDSDSTSLSFVHKF